MSSITSLRDSSNSRLQFSLVDDESQKLVNATKQALKTLFLTRDQSVALDQAIQTLTLKCFKKSDNNCQSPEDITKMFSQLLATFSFKHMIDQKPSDTQAVNLSLKIEKQQMTFCRVVDFFCRMVSNKNPHWNNYEFSSSFENSSKSPYDFFQLKLSHDPLKKVLPLELVKPRPIFDIVQDLINSEECVIVDSRTLEGPPRVLSLGERISRFALSFNLQRFLPTFPIESTKSE